MHFLSQLKALVLDVAFPLRCAGCTREGTMLCEGCEVFLVPAEPLCFECGRPSADGVTHEACFKPGSPDGMIALWDNESIAAALVQSDTGAQALLSKGLAEAASRASGAWLELLSSARITPLSGRDRALASVGEGVSGTLLFTRKMGQERRREIRERIGKIRRETGESAWVFALTIRS